MEKLAIAVMPIADIGAWNEFAAEISTGARADAHREFLRRGGVQAERAFHQQTPMGDLMVLVWEGAMSSRSCTASTRRSRRHPLHNG